jgi:ornithine lipid ester-linked acyl 2-hydroxylase
METIHKRPFYDQPFAIVDDLEKNFDTIKSEYLLGQSKSLANEWHQNRLYNHGWNVFGFRYERSDIMEARQLCPFISSLIDKYDDLIFTIGFSTLDPGTIIYPHYGYVDTVLRCHLGIIIPDGDCALRVGDVTRKWQEGKAFVFDDTFEHEAWNKTEGRRTVMLMDFKKDRLEL